jgi:hypothetical protein
MRRPALVLSGVLVAALGPAAPGAAETPASVAALEGRGPGAAGSVARELGAGQAALRFAAPAGGSAELVLYLAAAPRAGALELRSGAALASLLGVPGEVRLAERRARSRAAEPLALPLETAPEPVPEPGVAVLTALGLGLLARLARRRASCQSAGRWSGPPAA